MKKNTLLILLLSVLTIVALASCTTATAEETETITEAEEEMTQEGVAEEETAEKTDEEADSGTLVVTHKLGTVEIPANPTKVVSLDMAAIDTMTALGVEDALTGASDIIPTYLADAAADAENVGSMFEPDFEAIAELQPDLIFISARSVAVYEDLAEIAPIVYFDYPGIDNPNIVDTVASNVGLLGEIFNKADEAAALVDELETAVADTSETVAALENRDALMLIITGKEINAYGPEVESRYGYVFNIFNFNSTVSQEDLDLEANKHGQSISFEFIAEIDPDYIFVIDRGVVTGATDETASDTLDNAFVESTKAFQNDHIVYVSPEEWYLTVGGYNSLMTIVNELAAAVN